MGLRQNEEALGKGNCYQISADCARISTAGGKSQSQSQQLMDQSIKHHMLSLCTLSDLQNRFGKTHLACTDMDPWANTGQTADLLFVV